MADFFIILFDKKILPLSLPTCSDYKWCGIFFVTYYSTTYNKKSILCICSVWIGKKILVACSISSRWTRLRHAMVYTFYFNSVSTITHIGICSRDAYHCQCHRHVQEGSISQHYSNFSGIQYFQDIDTILMIADHPAFTKNAGNSRH